MIKLDSGHLQNSEPNLVYHGAKGTWIQNSSSCLLLKCLSLCPLQKSWRSRDSFYLSGLSLTTLHCVFLALQSTHIDGHKKNSVRHKLVSLTLKKKSKLTEEVRGDAWPPGSTSAVGLSAALSDSLLLFPRQHRTSPPLGLALPVSLPERFKECLRGKVGFPCLLESFCTSRRPPLGSRSPSIQHLPSPLSQPSVQLLIPLTTSDGLNVTPAFSFLPSSV